MLSPLNRMITALQEVTQLQNALVDSAGKCVQAGLAKFVREDIRQMKDTKGYFNKISSDLGRKGGQGHRIKDERGVVFVEYL